MKSGDIVGKSRKRDSLIFIGLLFITVIVVICATFLFYDSFQDGKETVINYNEDFNMNYKVWLEDNDFYSEKYLGEEYNVIASAIDEIEVDFDYLLSLSDNVQGESYYLINSRIVAHQKNDASEKKIWDYGKLIKDKVITKYDKNTATISSKDNFKIDYQQYKKLMDDYQRKYAVSLVGNLLVDVEIKSDLTYDKFKDKIDMETRKMTLTIPLTESVVNITKDIPDKSDRQLIEKENSKINYLKLGLSLFAFVGGIFMCVFLGNILVKLLGFDSKYQRKLNKILRTYNSIIVNVEKIKIDKCLHVMNVNSFDELLDAQSELRVPILYSNLKNNKESMFVIKHDKDMFVYTMKSDLYDNQNKKGNCDKDEKN